MALKKVDLNYQPYRIGSPSPLGNRRIASLVTGSLEKIATDIENLDARERPLDSQEIAQLDKLGKTVLSAKSGSASYV